MIVLSEPAIDYLTMTTYDAEKWRDAREIVSKMSEKVTHEVRVMQYTGNQFDNTFVGEGLQNGTPHYMIKTSGYDAQLIFPHIAPMDMKPTRVDVQVTLTPEQLLSIRQELEREEDWRESDTIQTYLHEMYNVRPWSKGRRKKVSLYANGGLDTLYVGAREKSRLFARLYTKELPSGEMALRYELELKLEAAKAFLSEYNKIGNIAAVACQFLLDEVTKYPDVCPVKREVMRTIADYKSGDINGIIYDTKDSNLQSTMNWLREAVTPSINRLLHDHDFGPECIRWIISMASLAGIDTSQTVTENDKTGD